MSESRTHEASPRKIARAYSGFGRPTSHALTAAAALGAFALLAPAFAERLQRLAAGLWANALAAGRAPTPGLRALPSGAALELTWLVAGIVLAVALTAAAAHWLQRGAVVRWAGADAGIQLEPGFHADRLPRALIAAGVWLLVFLALLWPWSAALRGMLAAWQRAPAELPSIAGSLALALATRAALALLVVGTLELGLQRVWFRRRLRMSRRELQDEARATEGDPHARGERRRRAHELLFQATLLELSEVSLIVFDSERTIGLRTTASGAVVWIVAEGEQAARLRRAAEERAIPFARDPELASVLAGYEPNEPLPPSLSEKIGATAVRAGRKNQA